MPIPIVGKSKKDGAEFFDWLNDDDLPQTIGQLSGFMGNAGVLLRAYIYMRMVGRNGMKRIAEFATLNANYLEVRLKEAGFELVFPDRRASHEFIITLRNEAKTLNVNGMDFAKALLDKGFHAPTTYFPLLVPECLLIEPTETETKESIDRFVEAMVEIREEAKADPGKVKGAPYTTPVRRLDDVKAARRPDLTWKRT